MDTIREALSYILHLNEHLATLVATFGLWSYAILFLIIFAETGLVILPFLPGDALLFAAGSLTSLTDLNAHTLVIVLVTAAILGNTSNYAIGSWVGPKVFHFHKSRFFNPESLHKTHKFYKKYGGRALVFARFIPLVRTFAPFVAGVGRMHYWRFQMFNVIGALAWVTSIVYIGHWVGSSPIVQKNFSFIIIGFIVLSIIPAAIEILRQKFGKK